MRWTGILGAAAVLLALALPPAAPAAGVGPRIRFERTSADYGRVPAGQIVRHRFRFRNEGDAPLRITNPLWRGKFIRTKALEGC